MHLSEEPLKILHLPCLISYQMKKFILLVYCVVLFATVISCRKEFNNPNWDVDLLAPILNAKLTIYDLLNDTLIRTGDDSLVSLVYQNQLYRFSLDSFLNVPDINYRYSSYLDSIKMNDIIIQQEVKLGEIIQSAGLGLLLPDGSTHEIVPFSGISTSGISINATQYFQTMTLIAGSLDITVINNLPVDITNLVFQLTNANDNMIVLQDTFPLIEVGDSVLKTQSLEGKTVNGNLVGKIINMDTPGSYGVPVLINYADLLITKLRIYDLVPFAATAILPSQDLMNTADTIKLLIDDIQLGEIIIRSGHLELDAYNTMGGPIHYTYFIHSCTLNGDTFNLSGTIDPAVNGQVSVLHQDIDLAGYSLNLRGAGPVEQFFNTDMNHNGYIDEDTINTIFVTAIGRIDSTGNVSSLSLQDSFVFTSRMKDIVPEYATGYLGRDTFNSNSVIEFNVFEGLQDGSISLEDTKISLSVWNQVGASAKVRFNNITTSNSVSGSSKSLVFPAGSNSLVIDKPIDPLSINVPVKPTVTTLYLNYTNSNAQELINLIPDQIQYDFDLFLNPAFLQRSHPDGNDFVYYDGILTASLDIEIPLSMAASCLTLMDTADFNLDPQDVENINGGYLDMWIKNWFPLRTRIQLYTLDVNMQVNDSLFSGAEFIGPGVILSGQERVTEPVTSNLKIYLTDKRLQELTVSKKIKIIARFDTYPSVQHVKIFSDYIISFRIAGDINYHVN
jgi:hypothetical protein